MTATLIQLTYDEWVDKYRPIVNPNSNYDEIAFDTHDKADVDFIASVDPNRVWTLGSDCNVDYISSGWHYVNRLEYYVTEVPFDDEVAVLIAREDDCACMADPEDYETANPECDECEGSGFARIYYTREMIDAEN